MRYVKQIHIRNFQSHEDTTIRLSPGINAITGATDAGKSAVLRALRWAAWNITPDGDWIRQGCTYISVELTMSDGAVITRERRGTRNRYLIALPDAEPLVLEGFGLKCPEEVLKAHGMRPVPFSADKPTLLNFASQHEAPFFLSETAPERARILGRLAGVHVIDYAIRGANRDVQQQSREVSRLEADLADVEQDLESYAGLEAEEQRVARAEQLLARAQEAAERLDRLSAIASRLAEVRQQQQEIRQVLARLRHLDVATAALAQAEARTTRSDTLMRHQVHLTGTRQQLAQVRAALHVAIRASKAEGPLTGAAQAQDRLQRLSTLSTTYQTTLQQLRAAQRILATADQAMAAGFRLENATLAADRLNRLAGLRDQFQRIRREMAAVDDVLTEVQDAGAALAALRAAEEAERRREALQDQYYTLVEFRGRMEKGRGVLAALAQQIQAAAQAYGAALQEAGVCPTCLQQIDPQTAARIAAGLQNGKGEHSHVA